MKILKLLNKIYLIIVTIFFLITSNSFSENEPVDIMKSAVTMIANPKKEMIDGYNAVSSKIAIPQKPKIIT